jgi:transposase
MPDDADDLANFAGAVIDDSLDVSCSRVHSSISNEKRELIMHAINELGMSVKEAATFYKVARTTVSSIKQVYYSENGRTSKKTNRGRREPKLSQEQQSTIRDWVDDNCLLTLPELRQGCQRQLNVEVSESTLSRMLRNFHYTVKRTSVVVERVSWPEVIQARMVYATEYLRIMSRRHSLYFVDESGFSCSMRRKVGRALEGERAVVRVPAIRSKNFSLCAAYNINTMFHFEVQGRPYNTANFLIFVRAVTAKFTTEGIINAILIMDNVPFHHSRDIREHIEGSGNQLMFLPPYSPFLNPIENVFNQWKNSVKSARPSNEQELLTAIHSSCDLITPEQCHNYFGHMETFIPMCLNGEDISG